MFFVVWKHLDHVVNAQNGNGRFSCELQTLDFRHCRFQHTCLLVVTDAAIRQIEADPGCQHSTGDYIKLSIVSYNMQMYGTVSVR